MSRAFKHFTFLSCLLAGLIFSLPVHAATVIKIDFGADSMSDLEMASQTLTTIDDGNGSTPGDQDTNVLFLGFLSGESATDASFTLAGVAMDGLPDTSMSPFLSQLTDGGSFSLWSGNDLLISATLSSGVIGGAIGVSATGAFLTLDLGQFTGGSLLSQLDPNSASLAISFTNVNGGTGFSVNGGTGELDDFTAGGTGNIAATVPEPSALAMLGLGLVGLCSQRRRSA
jgi:hypothetical protein